MKVYEIHYDNGEAWEDSYDCTEKIYASYEAAKKHFDDDCYVCKEHEAEKKEYEDYITLATYKRKKYVCSTGQTSCNDCQKYIEWEESDCEEEDFCDEYDKMWDDYYSYEWWEIREWEVLR